MWPLGYSMLRARRRRALSPTASGSGGHPVRPTLLLRRLTGSPLRLYVIYDGIRNRFHSRGDRYFPPYEMHRFLGKFFFTTSPIPFVRSLITSSNSFQIIPLRLALGNSKYVKGSRLTALRRCAFALRRDEP